ncbi:MAG: SMP-30/gluconolactonase/LRE family protein [Candidatus Thiodiazotropha sp.]
MPRGQADIPVRYQARRQNIDGNLTVPGSSRIVGGAVPSSLKLIKKDKIYVKHNDDKNNCLISGLDITVNGSIILADLLNCKIKFVSPEGLLLSSLAQHEIPIDVAVINKSEAAVSMKNKQISIIDIADSSHLSLKRIIKTEQYVWCITVYNNNLVIACYTSGDSPRSVQMIDMRGKVLWTTTTDSEGKNLFDCAWYLTTCSSDDGDMVIVTDVKKQTITVLDASTGKVVKVCDVKGKKPVGVTVDDNGNVFVCYWSGEITVWSRDMQEETRLITVSEYLKYPWAMAYNRRRSELVLTSSTNNTDYCDFIHRFRISIMQYK